VSATIVLEQVTVMHGERRALADVSLRIVAGETLSVLGSSGSGKTTLLRAVAGFVTPDVGMIRIGDAVASESGRSILPPEERGVAMVFQDLALWPHLTVRGNLEFGLECKRVPRDERETRIGTILTRVGPCGKWRRHPG